MSRAAIGIDIGGTNIKAGIVDESGEIIRVAHFPTEVSKGKPSIIDNIIAQVRSFQTDAAADRIDIVGVGVGTAGYVDTTGTVAGATANIPGWGGTDFAKEVGSAVGLPVSADNDANAFAVGECWVGAGATWDTFLAVTLGTGIGGCLIADRKPYRGRSGFAGGYGHQVIVVDGYSCTCGFRGCWEQYASVSGLKRLIGLISSGGGAGMSPERCFAEARAGNAEALDIVEQYAYYVAVGLTNLIHIFNPPAIIVGGAITAQGDFLFDRIRSKVNEQVMPVYIREPLPIVPARLGNNAGIIGAAKLALDRAAAPTHSEQ